MALGSIINVFFSIWGRGREREWELYTYKHRQMLSISFSRVACDWWIIFVTKQCIYLFIYLIFATTFFALTLYCIIADAFLFFSCSSLSLFSVPRRFIAEIIEEEKLKSFMISNGSRYQTIYLCSFKEFNRMTTMSIME